MLRAPSGEVDVLHDQLWRRFVAPCPLCRGTGKRTVADPGDPLGPGSRVVRCACLQTVSLRCRSLEANLPREFWGLFEERPPEWNLPIWERVRAYAADLRGARDAGRGWVFCGENGVGKSSFACWVLTEAMRAGFTAGYITAPEYLGTVIPARQDEELGAWFRSIQSADFLVLDEMGKEHRPRDAGGTEGGFALAELDSLVRQRRQNLLPTLMVTNYSPSEWRAAYGESFASAVYDKCEFALFESGDFREETARRERKKRGGK